MAEPDYEGFVRHLEEWDAHHVCYSLRDMVELTVRYGCPISEELRDRCKKSLEQREQA